MARLRVLFVAVAVAAVVLVGMSPRVGSGAPGPWWTGRVDTASPQASCAGSTSATAADACQDRGRRWS